MILIATQCFPPDHGGIETLMGGLAEALQASGQQVMVLADGARATGSAAQGLDIRRFIGPKPVRRRLKAWAVHRLLAGGQVTGLFADSWKSAELVKPGPVPLVVLAHGMEFPSSPSRAKAARITAALAKARCVIASSAFTATLVQPYLRGQTRLVVINPPIPPMPEAEPAAIAAVEGMIEDRSPVLLSLCRLEPRKGLDKVIAALPQVLARHPKALFVIAGRGEDRSRLEQLAAASGVSAHVHFAGMVDGPTKTALFAGADAFVMPTRRDGDSVEGFGIVYLEAGWYGLAALAGREGGGTDAVIHRQTGIICDATDPASVAAGILDLLADRAAGNRMGQAAAARARGPAQWQAAVHRYLEALT
jgi:phosphatidyl-myo-inositol dimannoside synthase